MTEFALVIVDVQEDYLQADSLTPDRQCVIEQIERVLNSARNAGIPVAHVRSLVGAGGENSMPHRRQNSLCVEGTFGASVPEELVEQTGELVAVKQFYSGFNAPELEGWLRQNQAQNLVIVGLFTHACVRETALDAYQRGFTVSIVTDAVASPDQVHAESTLAWIGSRGVSLINSEECLSQFASVSQTGDTQLSLAVRRASNAQLEWSQRTSQERSAALGEWAAAVRARSEELSLAISAEVHKPLTMARDEISRSIEHILSATSLVDHKLLEPEMLAGGIEVSRRPQGVVGILMPWNNPIALPVSTISAALVMGNAIVFKPAPQANYCASLILETLATAGIPSGLVAVVQGDAEVGMKLVRHPLVSAIALTGSVRTGLLVAQECAAQLKTLRAELGGNNAAIVSHDADLDHAVPALVRSAFAYSGQRCTALRRFIVEESILEDFTSRVIRELNTLEFKPSSDPDAIIGPLISQDAARKVMSQIQEAINQGCSLITGGDMISVGGLAAVSPTLLQTRDANATVVQQETFGPVAVIQPAKDIQDAIALSNGVAQGLLLAVATQSAENFELIRKHAEVGIVQYGVAPLPVHADAPFGGWKASGFGGAEHGKWDIDFFTKPQVTYL